MTKKCIIPLTRPELDREDLDSGHLCVVVWWVRSGTFSEGIIFTCVVSERPCCMEQGQATQRRHAETDERREEGEVTLGSHKEAHE